MRGLSRVATGRVLCTRTGCEASSGAAIDGIRVGPPTLTLGHNRLGRTTYLCRRQLPMYDRIRHLSSHIKETRDSRRSSHERPGTNRPALIQRHLRRWERARQRHRVHLPESLGRPHLALLSPQRDPTWLWLVGVCHPGHEGLAIGDVRVQCGLAHDAQPHESAASLSVGRCSRPASSTASGWWSSP
jgi:hypothetical protein